MRSLQVRDGLLAASFIFAVSCNRSSHYTPEVKPEGFLYGVEMSTSDPSPYALTQVPVVMKMQNGTSTPIFGNANAGCSGAYFSQLRLLDASGAVVASAQDDCLGTDQVKLGPGDVMSSSLLIDLSYNGGPIAGAFLLEGKLALSGPIGENQAFVQGSSGIPILAFPSPRVVLPVVVQGGVPVIAGGPSVPVLSPIWSLYAQTDEAFYPQGGVAKIDAILKNITGANIHAESPSACIVRAEIVALGAIPEGTVVANDKQVCATVITPIDLPSGSVLERKLNMPLVDDQGVILPAGFYLIRVIFELGNFQVEPPAALGSIPVPSGNLFGIVEVPIQIL